MQKTRAYLVLSLLCLWALDSEAEEIARLYSAKGTVEAKQSSGDSWQEAKRGQHFSVQDSLRTGTRSRAGVRFLDGYLLRLKEKTSIVFQNRDPLGTDNSLSISNGAGYFFSRTPKQFPRIVTPQVSASVRGTEFTVTVTGEQTTISVLDGQVEAKNDLGSVLLGKGERAVTRTGKAPVKQILVNPNDAVQWALYYPAVLSLQDFADFYPGANKNQQEGWKSLLKGDTVAARKKFTGATWRDVMGRSIAAYLEGNLERASQELNSYSGQEGAGFLLYSSGLYLSHGQIKLAKHALSHAKYKISDAPEEARSALRSALYSQHALLDIVQNQKERAFEGAKLAASHNPRSASAALVNSYVSQSFFRLGEAISWLENAVSLEPNNQLANARLAEMLLGMGDSKRAQSVLSPFLQLQNPDPQILVIAGFASLTRYNTLNAKKELQTCTGK